jgi:hypothetical protein
VVAVTEVLTHWHAGSSISEVPRSLWVDRNTVRKYVAPALAAGIRPAGEPISPDRWAQLLREWFPELTSTELRHPRFNEIAPYHQLIERMLATNTVTTVHQRLRDECGLGVPVSTFRRYVCSTMPDLEARRGQVTVRTEDRHPARRRRSTTATWASGETR